MTVSVLVPTYNRSQYIEESLESLLAQRAAPAQVIVIDDGSTDQTPAIVRRFAPHVTYIRKENGGKSSALNVGLRHVTGKYVWIFDDDDAAFPDATEQHLEILETNPQIGFTYSNHVWGTTGPDGRIEAQEENIFTERSGRLVFLQALRYCFFMLSGVIARRECYLKVGPFREDLLRSQDYEMAIRLARHFEASTVKRPTYILRRHAGTRGGQRDPHAEAEKGKVWRKYDHKIGEDLRNSLALEDYLTTASAPPLSEAQRREALLRRVWMCASKGMLDAVIEDLTKIVAENRQCVMPLTGIELELSSTAFDHPSFFAALDEQPDFWTRLAVIRSSPTGRTIMGCIAKGLFWRLTKNDIAFSEKTRLAYTVCRLGVWAHIGATANVALRPNG